MAKANKQSSALARLAECVTVAIDGKDIRVPVGVAENKVMNCLLISRARTMIEEQIKKYNEQDTTLTPRELKDLIDSVVKMSEGSAMVYSSLDGSLGENDPKKSGDPVKDAQPVVDINFAALTPKEEPKPA